MSSCENFIINKHFDENLQQNLPFIANKSYDVFDKNKLNIFKQ
jgi:hypothetical protein